MKAKMLLILVCLLAGVNGYSQSLTGKEIFEKNCVTCHAIGSVILGPDLADVTERRSEEWIKSFVKNSQKMVAEGDEQAVEVFNKFNKNPMPSHNFSDEELTNLVSYIAEESKVLQEVKRTNTPKKGNENEPPVVTAGGSNWLVSSLLGILGIAVVLLVIIAGCLYKVLTS